MPTNQSLNRITNVAEEKQTMRKAGVCQKGVTDRVGLGWDLEGQTEFRRPETTTKVLRRYFLEDLLR